MPRYCLAHTVYCSPDAGRWGSGWKSASCPQAGATEAQPGLITTGQPEAAKNCSAGRAGGRAVAEGWPKAAAWGKGTVAAAARLLAGAASRSLLAGAAVQLERTGLLKQRLELVAVRAGSVDLLHSSAAAVQPAPARSQSQRVCPGDSPPPRPQGSPR
jgi:hypothetical protein